MVQNSKYMETFKQIHKSSWGFFIPPRNGDHIVILASLNDLPVGMAYLNKTTLILTTAFT